MIIEGDNEWVTLIQNAAKAAQKARRKERNEAAAKSAGAHASPKKRKKPEKAGHVKYPEPSALPPLHPFARQARRCLGLRCRRRRRRRRRRRLRTPRSDPPPPSPPPSSHRTVQKIGLGRTARRRLGYDLGYVPAHGAREGRRRASRRRRPRTPANERPPPGKKAAAVLAGGSVDTRLLCRIVGRGLAEAGAS